MAAAAPPAGVPAVEYPERFVALIKKLEVDSITANDLYTLLSSCDITLLCDDSGSMTTLIPPEIGAPIGPPVTRWDELKRFAATLIDFVTSINPEGLDIAFLNRPGITKVTSMQGLQPLFSTTPSSSTPLGTALTRILQRNSHLPSLQRHQLIIIATDGEPSDCTPDGLYSIIAAALNPWVHISAVEFTDNEETMAYMDGWNVRLATFDNTDDYRVDLRKVRALRGVNYRYDYNSWVLKILMGSFMQKYKQIDMGVACCTLL